LAEAHREEFNRLPQLRHILLYLLFPDYYERIASEGHKARICEAFSKITDGETPDDIDDHLNAIRRKLTEFLPSKDLDFYWEPLRSCWHPDDESETLGALQALHIKKQIVLYGPPGTGKTYQARDIAGSLIRQHLLKLWGPRRFFSTPDKKLAELIAARTHRVQFHPGYGYEDFVRGVQIGSNGQTEYRDGVLLRMVEDMKRDSDEDSKIPVVLILDEMNRADLSRVLGECFSLLEDRDTDVRLGGHDEKPRKVRLPANLYIIGTMNLIDQSLEHVDFALRRRFLWFFRGFFRDDFLAVSRNRWDALLNAGDRATGPVCSRTTSISSLLICPGLATRLRVWTAFLSTPLMTKAKWPDVYHRKILGKSRRRRSEIFGSYRRTAEAKLMSKC
jgi:5-methylcytosine-specific restriction protein B